MAKVKIQGHASGTGVLTVTAPNTSTDRTLTLPDSTGTLLTADGDGSSLTGIATPITALNSATANELVTVGATTTELDAEANLTFDGTDLTLGTGDIVFGTAGKGICLGATSNTDANTLDDYEEGTFTLAMYSGWDGSITNTYAKYTKIGNAVTINFFGNIADADTNSNVRFSGFPFSLNNSWIRVTAIYSKQQSVALAIDGDNGYVYYQNTTVNGNNLGEDAAWLKSSTYISIQATYITA